MKVSLFKESRAGETRIESSLSLGGEVDLAREEASIGGFLAGTGSRTSLAAGTSGSRRLRVLGLRTVTRTLSGGAGACWSTRVSGKIADKLQAQRAHERQTYDMSNERPGRCSRRTSSRRYSSWRIACRTSRWLSGRRHTPMSGHSTLLV